MAIIGTDSLSNYAIDNVFRSLSINPSLGIAVVGAVIGVDSLSKIDERRSVIPWLMLPPENNRGYKFYRLREGDVVEVDQIQQQEELDVDDFLCLGSLFQGWLVYIHEKDCQLYLFNPLNSKNIKLPSVETLTPSVKGVIRNSQSGLIESFLDYNSNLLTPQQFSKYIISKVVLSSSPEDDDCIAMIIYGHNDRLAFCRRPGDANSWITLDGPLFQYTHIVFHSKKKLFFALTYRRELEAWDLHKEEDPIKRFQIKGEYLGPSEEWPISYLDDEDLEYKSSYCIDSDYLVYDHQSHELFIVTRYTAAGIDQDGTLILSEDNLDDQFPYKTHSFDVFKIDFLNDDTIELQYMQGNLGNRAFFIGSNPGYALSTTQFPELRPNSIYFTDDQTWGYRCRKHVNCGGHDLGIYDYKGRSFSSCYYPMDLDKIQRILPAPIWFSPDVDAHFFA